MCRLVEASLGITMLPEGVLKTHLSSGRLRMIRLNEDWAWRQLYLVVRNADELSPIARTLIDELRRAAASSQH